MIYKSILQFIMSSPSTAPAQVRHDHDLDHQTSPTREMLRALSRPRLRIILFPCESCPLPLTVNILDKIFTEFVVNFSGLLLMWALGLSNVLEIRHVY